MEREEGIVVPSLLPVDDVVLPDDVLLPDVAFWSWFLRMMVVKVPGQRESS